MSKFIASWLAEATEILGAEFSRPVNLLPGAAIAAGAKTFTLMVDLAGDWSGTFTVTVDQTALATLLEGIAASTRGDESEGAESKPAEPEALTAEAVEEEWQRLFRLICLAAAADVGKGGRPCEVAMISPDDTPVGSTAMGYQLHAEAAPVMLLIADLAELAEVIPPAAARTSSAGESMAGQPSYPGQSSPSGFPGFGFPAAPLAAEPIMSPGIELLLDVELEASLRFGSREMALSELLALGPGDVVQLDRALADPVDLIIGDKIVARGEVVLVNGNFGLQVLEVAEPRKSLESIRCLF